MNKFAVRVLAVSLSITLVADASLLARQPMGSRRLSSILIPAETNLTSEALNLPALAFNPLELAGEKVAENQLAESYFPQGLRHQAEKAKEIFGLRETDRIYLMQTGAQQQRPDDPEKQLMLATPGAPVDEVNFEFQGYMSNQDQDRIFGQFDLEEDVLKHAQYVDRAQRYEFTFNLLHGGIGENVGRKVWKAKRLGLASDHIDLGAKGTDLGYYVSYLGKTEFMSLAELQLLRSIHMMSSGSPHHPVKRLIYQPIVNKESRNSFIELFNSTYFFDRLNPPAHPRTYRQVMKSAGIELLEGQELLLQHELPGIEIEKEYIQVGDKKERTTEGRISLALDAYMQTGGHGQMGVYFIPQELKSARPEQETIPKQFRVFANGDNANADMYQAVAPYMRDKGILVTQFNTVAMPADWKGGKVGARRTKSSQKVPDMMELAQAKAADRKLNPPGHLQESAFAKAGLDDQSRGRQGFNLNGYSMDEGKLPVVLADLYDTVGELEFYRIISPTYIPKGAKSKNGKLYVPIDATIGSAMHNINAWFLTDPRGRDILRRHGVTRFLSYCNVPRDGFAPVKNVWDIYFQTHTNYFQVDLGSLRIVDRVSDLTPPPIEIEDGKMPGYWGELQTMIDSFGDLMIQRLKSLHVKGPIKIVDAELRGEVNIINNSMEVVDLRNDRFKPILIDAGCLSNGHLVFENITLHIDEAGRLSIVKNEPYQEPATPHDRRADQSA